MNHIELEEFYDDQNIDGGMNPAQTVVELKEYSLKFNCCEKNSLRLVGMKMLINSLAATKTRTNTFRNLQFVPWVNNAGRVYGSQLLLREGVEGQEKNAIRLLDQELNTLYKYENETIQFGSQKVMLNPSNQDEFIVVIAA